MKRRMIMTIAVLAAAVLAGMLLAFISAAHETPAPGETQSVAAQSAAPESLAVSEAPPAPESLSEAASEISAAPEPELPQDYIIGEYQGWLAVFGAQGGGPRMVYDILVRSLPEYDRERLAEGIAVTGEAELERILEDYLS